MKVTNDQLEALLRQQSQTPGTTRAQTAQGGFEAALSEQMGLENAVASSAFPTAAAGQTSQASMISQMLLGSTQSESVDVDEDVIQSAFSQASGTLDMWDSYVNALGSSGQNGSLREAYSLLQGIDGQVSALKNSTASVRGQNAGLDSLVNELDVMTTTEKIKFNRGDYTAQLSGQKNRREIRVSRRFLFVIRPSAPMSGRLFCAWRSGCLMLRHKRTSLRNHTVPEVCFMEARCP